MGQRRRYFKVADSIGHEQWTEHETAMIVRLMSHMHERWARDGLTAAQASHCELGPTHQMHISFRHRPDIARTSLQRLANIVSMSVECRGDVIVIDWPKFPIFQDLESRGGPTVVPVRSSPHTQTHTQTQSLVHTRPSARLFDRFWEQYPRKVGKRKAEKAWNGLKPDEALVTRMLAALEWQRGSEDWRRDGGRFIPHPSSWLGAARWEDERPSNGRSDPDRTARIDKHLADLDRLGIGGRHVTKSS